MLSDLRRGWGTWKSFPQDVKFRPKGVKRKLRRWREEAVCVNKAKACAKALSQGRAWQFGGTSHISSMVGYHIPRVRYGER